MRKTVTALLSLGLAAVPTAPALAGDLLNEIFNYANGALTANATWTAHSGAGLKVIQVSAGQVTLQQSTGSGEDVNTAFTARSMTDKTYACFELNVPTTAGFTGNTYFAHFKDTGTSNFRARTYVAPPALGGSYTLALSNDGVGAQVLWGPDLNFGQTYKVVISYNASTGEAELWVDPVSEASTKISDNVIDGGTSAGLAISAFALRQATPTTGSVNQVIDNLGVGTSFDTACTTEPTPTRSSTWGQVKALYR